MTGKTKKKERYDGVAKRLSLDDRLRAVLNHWHYSGSDDQLRALGRPALERLLDSFDGKVDLWMGQSEMDGREYQDACEAGIAAFASANMGVVLRAFAARGWSDLRIALSGAGRVSHPRIVPYLLALCSSKEPLHRVAAVNYLAVQRDPRALDALVAALRDRSSFVRFCAIERLGEVGDERAIEPLRLLAKRSARSHLAGCAEEAVEKIRRRRRATSD